MAQAVDLKTHQTFHFTDEQLDIALHIIGIVKEDSSRAKNNGLEKLPEGIRDSLVLLEHDLNSIRKREMWMYDYGEKSVILPTDQTVVFTKCMRLLMDNILADGIRFYQNDWLNNQENIGNINKIFTTLATTYNVMIDRGIIE